MSRRAVSRLARRVAAIGFVFSSAAMAYAAAESVTAPPPPPPVKISPILQDLRSFNTVATVLHVGAHPDDENTQLITYFARGRGYRTAYLSLTRGDGGQNEIGPEFDEKLGVARTQELLAARKLDGGRQFFTRAIDFGYSKTPEETLTFWNRKEVLGDVVRIIRQFRPDVIVTRFPIPPGSGGHGHHTASAMLAVEAFKLAADPAAYPEQLTQGLAVWQAKRVVWNGLGAGRGGGAALTGPTVKVDIGGNDPVTGEGFGSIATRSRAMHITQFGFPAVRPPTGGAGPNEQTFMLLEGEPATQDLLDGVDTTWARVTGGVEIGALAEKAIADFNADDPAASVPALLELRKRLRARGAGHSPAPWGVAATNKGTPTPLFDPVVEDKFAQLDRIIRACLGLEVKTIATTPEVIPGEKLRMTLTASVRATSIPVTWDKFSGLDVTTKPKSRRLAPGVPTTDSFETVVPAHVPLTQPYWLREESQAGIARVADPKLIGQAENPPALPVYYGFTVGGEKLDVLDEPVHVTPSVHGGRSRRVDVIPPVSLRFASDVSLLKPGSTKPVVIEAVAARAGTKGTLRLNVPTGWKATPAQQPIRATLVGEKMIFTFTVTAPAQATTGWMSATAEVASHGYSNQRIVIDYAHLPLQLLQPPARARLVSVEFAAKGRNVGYLPGAGDDVARALEQLGYNVRSLTGADLTAEKLAGLDAVVIGVRAFNERNDLTANLPGLFAYVENGGTVIAQYNRPNALQTPTLGPAKLSIAGAPPALRVTDEKAPVTFLAPEHRALNAPNKITPADFEGWFQERGTYFPSSWDEQAYLPLLAMNDPGEAPLKSSVLIAQHGKGYYVYTGIAFFRQLPAGVPGAYRLFANLVSLGK